MAWHVAVGDEVALNQVLVEVETEKAVVELPSPFAGTVVELLAAAGETVASARRSSPSTPPAPDGGALAEEKVPMLVGYGPSEAPPSRRRRNGRAHRRPCPAARAAGRGRPAAGRAAGALHGPAERGRPGRRRPATVPAASSPARTWPRTSPGRRRPPRTASRPRDEGAGAWRPEAHGRGHGPQRGHGAAGLRVPDRRRHADACSWSSASARTVTSRGSA